MVDINGLTSIGTKLLGRSVLILKKHSPEILTTVGIVGMVASAVMASRATLKVAPVIDKIREGRDTANELYANIDAVEYDEKARNKDLAYTYMQGTLALSKLYGPAVSLGLSSIACIVAAHGIMHRRNVALVAAYKVVESGFSEYRKRVAAELGDDRENDLYRGVEREEVETKNGKKKTVIKKNPNGHSPYAKFFDELSSNWSKTPEYNLLFLKAQQNYANDLLHARGHVFLNDVYDMLDIPRTQAGQVVGWVISDDGDNFIDFGIYDFDSDKAREFVNGYEKSILLDFNVDGVIYDLI